MLQHWLLYCCFTASGTEARWPISDGPGQSGKAGTTEWRLDRGNRPKKTGETVDRRQNNDGSVKAVSPRHCPATCALPQLLLQVPVLGLKTMSAALLLMNSLDDSKQKRSNLLSPVPSPYSSSLLGKFEGPAPPPSSKISWSFDLAWNFSGIGVGSAPCPYVNLGHPADDIKQHYLPIYLPFLSSSTCPFFCCFSVYKHSYRCFVLLPFPSFSASFFQFSFCYLAYSHHFHGNGGGGGGALRWWDGRSELSNKQKKDRKKSVKIRYF